MPVAQASRLCENTLMNETWACQCDFCSGTVGPFLTHNEPLKVSGMVVLREGFTIGKCGRCGHRYFPVEVLKRAEDAVRNVDDATRSETVPVVAA